MLQFMTNVDGAAQERKAILESCGGHGDVFLLVSKKGGGSVIGFYVRHTEEDVILREPGGEIHYTINFQEAEKIEKL